MRIDVIESSADLLAVRGDWDRVYASDPHAQYFLSWIWLSDYLQRRDRWFILALREKEPGSPYVAFFPLRLKTSQDLKSGLFSDEISMGGNNAADYTGIISEPDYEDRAIRGFGFFLKNQNWASVKLDNFCGPVERRNALVRELSDPDVGHRTLSRRNEENIEHTICPVVTLPGSWDAYLETLSSQTRQKLRRFLRQVENDDAYRITVATKETISGDLDLLFRLWRARWVEQKGDRTDPIIATARDMLMASFRAGHLFVPVLWHGDRPLGALANMLDHQKKSVLFYMAGRDEEWKTPSPGLVLHAYAIRHAIGNGFSTYDFLRGDEAYKYMFGAENRLIHCSVVHTLTGQNRHGLLNTRSIGHVYEQGAQLYAKGEKRLAEAAFAQVAAAAPDHVGARFRLAQLLFDKGRLAEAEAAFTDVATRASDPVPVLIRLGDTRLALKKFAEAAETFAAVIAERPNSSQAYFKMGVAFMAQGRTEKAIETFKALEHLHSDDPAHAAYREKAENALARLVPSPALQLKLPAIHPSGFPLTDIGAPPRFAKDSPLPFPTAAIKYPELPLPRASSEPETALTRTKH